MDNKGTKKHQEFKEFEDFKDRVIGLSETERQQYETAKEISYTLQRFVDKQNNRSRKYIDDFHAWVEEKLDKKVRRKYFGNKTKEEVLRLAYKDIGISEKYKHYQNERAKNDPKNKKEIYEAIKRSFNNLYFHKKSDIDKAAAKKLLTIAGFFQKEKNDELDKKKEPTSNKKIFNIEPEESGKSGLTIDNARTVHGFSIENVRKLLKNDKKHATLLGSKAIISEKGEKSDAGQKAARPTSSTHIIYEFLKELKAFDPEYEGQIKRFVNFVDKVDSLNYQFSGGDYLNNYRTIFGLHKNMDIQDIYDYFAVPGRLGFELLDDKFMQKIQIEKVFYKNQQRQVKKMTLLDCSKEQKERIEKNLKEFRELKGRGIKLANLSFIVTFGNEITDPAQVGSYFDCGIIRILDNGDFYLYSPEKLPETIGGEKTDEHFLIIKKIPLAKLEKILGELNPIDDTDKNLGNDIWKYRESMAA